MYAFSKKYLQEQGSCRAIPCQFTLSLRKIFLMFRTVLLSLLQSFALGAVASSNWPQFRGPQGDGHSDASRLPTPWNETENVLWQTSIPGAGWSSRCSGELKAALYESRF